MCISSTHQGVSGASAAGLGTGCSCPGSTVHLLHRSRCWVSRLGSYHVQWELWALLLRKMMNLSSSISFTIEPMATKNAGPLPGCCWYYSKQLNALFSQLQFRMEISPSWTVRDRGLCFTCCWSLFSFCCPFTPA